MKKIIKLFIILFLISFSLGTICGNLLVRSILSSNAEWLYEYSAALADTLSQNYLRLVFLSGVPFLIVFILSFFAFCRKGLLFLICVRGCFLSYFLSACYLAGVRCFGYFIFTLFFFLCFMYYARWSGLDPDGNMIDSTKFVRILICFKS